MRGNLDKRLLTHDYLAKMEGKEPREPNFKDGFERLVCQEDLEDEEHQNYHQANRINLQGEGLLNLLLIFQSFIHI